jgi:hypothetical protein
MRLQTMTVLAVVCLAGSSARADAPMLASARATSTSPTVSAPSRAPMPAEILALPSTRPASRLALWSARETSQPTGIALLTSGQWIPVRDGRLLWIAHDQDSERAAQSVAYQYTYYPTIGWRRVVASGGLDQALLVRTPFGEFGALGGTPALGLGLAGRSRD